jgi:hypothetical protein
MESTLEIPSNMKTGLSSLFERGVFVFNSNVAKQPIVIPMAKNIRLLYILIWFLIMEELKELVKIKIAQLFNWMDMSDIVDLQNNILDEVCEDVMDSTDYPLNYNDSDIEIAISRVIINLTSIGK